MKLASLPDPANDPNPWQDIMLNYRSEWAELVAGYIFYGSPMCDAPQVSSENVLARWRCQLCPSHATAAFTSNKKLLAHQRAKHGCSNEVAQYVDGTGMCPCCGVLFSNRSRVIAHLSETRRRAKVQYATCRDRVLAREFPRVDQDALDAIKSTERLKQREAYKAGHSHVLVQHTAKIIRWANQVSSGCIDVGRPMATHGIQSHAQFQPARRITGKRPARLITWSSAASKRHRLNGPAQHV
jgi:hypothetical protein